MDACVVCQQGVNHRQSLFGFEDCKSIDSQPAHVWIRVIERLNERRDGIVVADLRERPRHNVLHIRIFEKWNQNGNGAGLLEIALFGLPW